MPYPSPTPPTSAPRSALSGSLDDALRVVLSRLDPRKATPEQVRDALDSGGLHVSLAWAQEWLEARRGR